MLTDLFSGLSFFTPQNDDDSLDKVHYYYTSSLLLAFAILFSFKLLAGKPMECWVPAEYAGGWENYAEMFCWARNTYFVPFESEIPEDLSMREHMQISYYQWTPFFLLVCAFAFYAPCIIWRILNDKSGIRLREIISVAQDPANIQPEERAKNVEGLARHLQSIFRHQYHFGIGNRNRATHKFARCFNWRYYEAYMTILYLGIKLLYLFNVSFQLYLMNWFLQTDRYSFYGVGVLWDLLNGREWQDSGNFPRVTMCDMQIRVLGNVQRHTVQCVLVINIFTEKLFILLWLWYTLLSVFTACSFVYWVMVSFMPTQRKTFVVRRLELADTDFCKKDCRAELDDFVDNWIKMDGVFVLRMITLHTGRFFVMEVVDAMWDLYREDQQQESEHNMKSLVPNDSVGSKLDPPGSPNSDLLLPPATPVTPRPNLRRKNSVLVPLIRAADHSRHSSGTGSDQYQYEQQPQKKSSFAGVVQHVRHASGPPGGGRAAAGVMSASAALADERRNAYFRHIPPMHEESTQQDDDA